jgi:uncharacterized protein YdeI (YjbR/CyaY-like superfamily)
MTITPRFFGTAAAWRRWLEEHYDSAAELWVGFHRKGSARASITWPEAVDQALCFGWIDGVRRRLDESSYAIRFTPRRPGSVWSAVNLAKVEALARRGLMRPAGVAAHARRTEARSRIYSYEQREAALPEAYAGRFRRHRAAWRFFEAQPAWYRRAATWWVISAKREETRERRLATLIEDSAAGRTIRQLTRPPR